MTAPHVGAAKPETMRDDFPDLSKQRGNATAGDSVDNDTIGQRAHERIVGMERPPLPMILEEMREHVGH